MNYYVVKKGDTLWGISKKFNITVQKLAKINKLNGSSIHKIQVGQKIYIDEINKIEAELILKIILLDLSFKPISKGIVKRGGPTCLNN